MRIFTKEGSNLELTCALKQSVYSGLTIFEYIDDGLSLGRNEIARETAPNLIVAYEKGIKILTKNKAYMKKLTLVLKLEKSSKSFNGTKKL